MNYTFGPITKDQAIALVKESAYPGDYGRSRIVHSFYGGMGADWRVSTILSAIKGAEAVELVPSFLDHNLMVRRSGDKHVLLFDVSRATGRIGDTVSAMEEQ